MTGEKIVGPPGTGKTSELLRLVEGEIARGLDPSEVGFCSFTRAAASEARARVATVKGFGDGLGETAESATPWFRTVHAACFRLLGLDRSRVATGPVARDFLRTKGVEYRDGSARDIEETALDDPAGGGADLALGNVILALDSWARNRLVPMAEAVRGFDPPARVADEWSAAQAVRVAEEWGSRRRAEELFDFTDMIEAVVERGLAPPVRVLFVDEFQDTSPLQWSVLERWADAAERVVVAGDSLQAIYVWGGADPGIMVGLGLPQRVLPVTWRLPVSVWRTTRRIEALNRVKELDREWSPRDGAPEGSVTRIRDDGRAAELCAAAERDGRTAFWLARNRFFLGTAAEALRDADIPYANRRGRSPVVNIRAGVRGALLAANGRPISIRQAAAAVCDTPSTPGTWLERGAKTRAAAAVKAGRADAPRGDWRSLVLAWGAKEALVGALGDPATCLTPFPPAKLDPEEAAYLSRLVAARGPRVLTDAPRVEIGTIHSAKGAEADTVVLDVAMTRRTADAWARDPDTEHRVYYVAASRARRDLVVLDAGHARDSYWPLVSEG